MYSHGDSWTYIASHTSYFRIPEPISILKSIPEPIPDSIPESTPESAPQPTPESAPEPTPESAPDSTPESESIPASESATELILNTESESGISHSELPPLM